MTEVLDVNDLDELESVEIDMSYEQERFANILYESINPLVFHISQLTSPRFLGITQCY